MDDFNKQNQAENDFEANNNTKQDTPNIKGDFDASSIMNDAIDELIRKIKEDTDAVDEILGIKPKIEVPTQIEEDFQDLKYDDADFVDDTEYSKWSDILKNSFAVTTIFKSYSI